MSRADCADPCQRRCPHCLEGCTTALQEGYGKTTVVRELNEMVDASCQRRISGPINRATIKDKQFGLGESAEFARGRGENSGDAGHLVQSRNLDHALQATLRFLTRSMAYSCKWEPFVCTSCKSCRIRQPWHEYSRSSSAPTIREGPVHAIITRSFHQSDYQHNFHNDVHEA